MKTARDGVRWHLIEKKPLFYDFSSLTIQAEAAEKTGIQIIWDLFHYGFPEDLDIFSPEFVERFVKFSLATAQFLRNKNTQPLYLCMINEISFFAWIAADIGRFYPFAKKRGYELKRQLVHATIASMKAIREHFPDTRFVQTDPAIRVEPSHNNKRAVIDAANYHEKQFEVFDMLSGKQAPELGGAPEYLDIIGVNYYFNNQWRHPSGRRIYRHHKNYQPFHEILENIYQRYQRPVFIAETGIENEARPDWFRYINEQAKIAESRSVPVHGICLYPILNHPGWDNNRHCHNGLWDYADDSGNRQMYQPLADALLQAFI
ncbi:MAG: hypothetical protein ACXWUD_11910 [Methylosarcina sp.]